MTKRIGVSFAIFCVVMIIYQIVSRQTENATLKEKGKLTVGQTLSFRYVFKSGNRVTYSFAIDGKTIVEDDEKTQLDGAFFQQFRNRTFPVIYDPDRPSKTNRILLTKSDFIQFNVPLPDTLKMLVGQTN